MTASANELIGVRGIGCKTAEAIREIVSSQEKTSLAQGDAHD
jgi:ERCC4-type nuclease